MKNNMGRRYDHFKGNKPLWLTPYPSYCMMKMGIWGKAALLKVDVTDLEIERYVLFGKSTLFEFLIYDRIPPKNISVLKKFNSEALFRKVNRGVYAPNYGE